MPTPFGLGKWRRGQSVALPHRGGRLAYTLGAFFDWRAAPPCYPRRVDPQEPIEDEALELDALDVPEAEPTLEALSEAELAARPATAGLPSGAVSADDRGFLQRVFSQVREVDFKSPPPPPPRLEAGPEKKLVDLRERVRRLERDLARIGSIWTQKQTQVDALDAILEAKEQARAAAESTQVRVQAEAAQLRQALEAARALASTLGTHKQEGEAALRAEKAALAAEKAAHAAAVADLRAQLERQAAQQVALAEDCRHKIEAAQAAFTQLREQSAHSIGGLEAQLLGRDEGAAQLRLEAQQLQERIDEREARIDAEVRRASAAEAEMSRRLGDLEARLLASQAETAQMADRLGARERTVQSLGEKLAEGEARLLAQQQEASSRQAAQQEELARMQRDLTAAVAEVHLLRHQPEG